MSSGPIARWLETFVCTSMSKKYVEVFQEFGYNNLNDVCNLNAQQLLKMGVSIPDTEKIIDNVSVLKQTMQGNTITTTTTNNNTTIIIYYYNL
jgi:LytS/YehU family sensor histidine kinase